MIATRLPMAKNAAPRFKATMNPTPSNQSLAQFTDGERFLIANKRKLMLASFLIAFVVTAIILGPYRETGAPQGPHNARMQQSRQIGQVFFSYATDHDGKYPAGTSSTDIFQQMIDQGYVNDPELFYFDMPGKTKATSKKLKPENVCFDLTSPVLADDPDTLPLVMSTGYKIDYIPGGKAHLLANGDPYGIAILFKGNNAAFLKAGPGGIPLFPPAFPPSTGPVFDPKGKSYRQLTPDGPLP
jgi:hypothetical protein